MESFSKTFIVGQDVPLGRNLMQMKQVFLCDKQSVLPDLEKLLIVRTVRGIPVQEFVCHFAPSFGMWLIWNLSLLYALCAHNCGSIMRTVPVFVHLCLSSFSELMLINTALGRLFHLGTKFANSWFLKIIKTPLLQVGAQRANTACVNHQHHSATLMLFH